MKNFVAMALLILLALSACQQSQQQETDTESETVPERDIYENIIPSLKACIAAHGGLDTWNNFKTMTYVKVSGENGEERERHLIDLANRKVLITKKDAYTIGFNGEEVWLTPDEEAFKGSARFYHNLHFYFFAIPFVMADPGVDQEFLGEVTFNGQTYDKIKITFGENVGDAPEDQYILWVNKDNNMLDFINYSVTYYDESRAEQYNARVYTDYTEVNGLKFPGKMISYVWENDTLAQVRGTTGFEDIELKEAAPNQELFAIPDGAYIDELPSGE